MRGFETVLPSSGYGMGSWANSHELARMCLARCIGEHDRGTRADGFFPTRVIDIGGANADRLRLYTNTAATSPGKYAALSYCWGKTTFIGTTSANLQDHQAGFSLSSLPWTLRDAFHLTRELRLRYLWVDALCIMQGTDSQARDDWRSEVNQM